MNFYIKKMSRLQPYRSRVPTHIIKLLDVSSRITLFLVGQNGPLSFIFKDRLENKYKTSIGAQIKCSCSLNKNDHCIHSLYILLKIFKISIENPMLWQASYIDSQLSDLVAGKHTIIKDKRNVQRPVFDFQQENTSFILPSDFYVKKQYKKRFDVVENKAQRMSLQADSVCPICQQDMSKNMCLTYCKVGCGNNYHLQCFRVWVSHKKNQQQKITCPMCRQQYNLNIFDELKTQEIQFKKKQVIKKMHKYKCSSCGLDQIIKNVHKCILCQKFQLCQACYLANKHIKHPFLRHNQIGQWQPAQQRRAEQLKIKQFIEQKRQQSKNKQILEKLRAAKNIPSSLIDTVCNAYPYVSKYISDNIDPYKKLNIEPQTMQCQVCLSKRMIFLRRLPCQHFIDHQCLKQRIRKGLMYCQKDGTKILKGYEEILKRQKEQQYEQKRVQWKVDDQFSVKHLQEMLREDEQNNRGIQRVYPRDNNFQQQNTYNFIQRPNFISNQQHQSRRNSSNRSSDRSSQRRPSISQIRQQRKKQSHESGLNQILNARSSNPNSQFRISRHSNLSKQKRNSSKIITSIRNNSLDKNIRSNIIKNQQIQKLNNDRKNKNTQIYLRNKVIKPQQGSNRNFPFLPPFQMKY